MYIYFLVLVLLFCHSNFSITNVRTFVEANYCVQSQFLYVWSVSRNSDQHSHRAMLLSLPLCLWNPCHTHCLILVLSSCGEEFLSLSSQLISLVRRQLFWQSDSGALLICHILGICLKCTRCLNLVSLPIFRN